MEDDDAEGDDVKGEEASILIFRRRRKKMMLRRKTGIPTLCEFWRPKCMILYQNKERFDI